MLSFLQVNEQRNMIEEINFRKLDIQKNKVKLR